MAPDLVVEVLSPFPRIGALDERLEWFARYGVAECWVVDLLPRAIDVLVFDRGEVANRRRFGASDPIRARVLPEFSGRLASMLG